MRKHRLTLGRFEVCLMTFTGYVWNTGLFWHRDVNGRKVGVFADVGRWHLTVSW